MDEDDRKTFRNAIDRNVCLIKFRTIVDRICTHMPATCIFCEHKKKDIV